MRAEPHPEQARRLAALRSYGILDTPPEAAFDEIVALTAAICEAPISVVNLIDADRQWFKAEVGLGTRETPLETSLCSHVILEDDFVEIPDTLADDRMADNPLCLANDGGLRFYAGALIKEEDGLPLGTLCVLDTKPRTLTPLQRDAVRVLSRQVMAQLDLRRQIRLAEVRRREVDHRVKNSLAAIAAYTRLKLRGDGVDHGTRRALQEVGQRIDSVSMVHAQLYRGDADGGIDMRDYLSGVVQALAGIAPSGVSVALSGDVPRKEVRARTAMSIGSFVNEAAGNAFKHGFGEDGAGTVTIMLLPEGDGRLRLSVRDDGRGMEDGAGQGLGMAVLGAAASDLRAELEVTSGVGGTTLSVAFYPPET